MDLLRLFCSVTGAVALVLGYCTILSAFLKGQRPKRAVKRVIPFLLYSSAYILIYFISPQHEEWIDLLAGSFISMGVYLFYRSGMLKAMVGTSLAISIALLADAILILAVSMVEHFKISAHVAGTLWMIKETLGIGVLFLALTKLFSVFFIRSVPRKELTMRLYRFGANVMPIICIVGAVSTVQQVYVLQIDDLNFSSLVVGIFTLLVLAMLSFYLFGELREEENLKTEKHQMEQQQRAYAYELKLEREAFEKSQRLRHDMKNHIMLIGEFSRQQDYKKLNAYISRLYREMEGMKLYANSGYRDLDSIINYKLSDAKEKGIKTDVSIIVPRDMEIDSFDLNVLLGNLLDNALEGIEKSAEKELVINLKFIQGVLYLTIRNTYDGIVNVDNKGRYYSRKADSEGHSIGLRNVKSVVEKYNGEMQIHSDEREFKVYVVLYPCSPAV